MKKQTATLSGCLARENVQGNYTIKTTERNAQRAHVLAVLQRGGSISTLDFRAMGIMHPAGRIRELRNRGHDIALSWRHVADDTGLIHRTGFYTLLRGGA